jgi:hypothetical protein
MRKVKVKIREKKTGIKWYVDSDIVCGTFHTAKNALEAVYRYAKDRAADGDNVDTVILWVPRTEAGDREITKAIREAKR